MRYSKQRELVMQTVQALCDHPTAEEIYDAAVKECPGLSLGTVYRNLNSLVDAGRVRRVSIPGKADRFDHTLPWHSHLYCTACGSVVDADVDEKQVMKLVRSQKGVVQDCAVVLFGLCEACAQKQAEASYRSAIEQGFCSLRLEPLAHGFSVDDLALLSPLMQVCAAFETPVWIYGTADVCCAPILFQDLAEAFPSVPVIIGYMGYNYEASSAISIAKRYANIYLDPTAAMKQNLMRAVNTAGPEKLLLGSGTPVASYFELEIEKIRLIESDPARQQLMLGGNAIRLFRL